VRRYAHQAAAEAHSNLRIIHAIQATDRNVTGQMDLEEQVQSEERQQAEERIADLQRRVGSRAPVRVVVGPIKQALLEAARRFDVDALIIGRSPQSGTHGRLRNLTYAMVRDSPFPVLSI
jgi:nucleotide-binding universal stress UspA family protein